MKKAVQLYSINKLCKHGLEQGLKAVSEMGYDGVEFAGFFDNTATTVLAWLKKYNLQVEGAHVAPELVFDNAKATIDFHKAIGNKRIIVPWYDIKTKSDVIELVGKFKAVAPLYEGNGMKLYYHNHAHEFVQEDGDSFIDMLSDSMDANGFNLQLDLYWVYRGGKDPVQYLNAHKSTIDTFHAKDGTDKEGTPVGKGMLDYANIFAAANKNGVEWLVVECEGDIDESAQLDQIKQSLEYINAVL